ncbi:MAG TPA: ribonuclease P protein component [bacterium]|nr:ribonuclease P protein component [bacterium]
MLKRENRLSSDFEFNITRKYGKYFNGKYFHIYFLRPKNYNGPTKVGIVVSNKFSKKAVERNRVKRIFREIVGNNLEKIGKDNIWVVIHPKISCQNKSYEEISAEFNKILQEAPFS